MTNLWLRLENTPTKELWFLNYEKGEAKRVTDAPKGESIRKWRGTVLEFLQQKEIKIKNQSDGQIKFQSLQI